MERLFNHQTIDEFLLDITETALAKADACPVVDIVETIAEKYNISTTLLCDTNHILYSDYSEVIVVGAGADAVDYKLISICHKGDVVVSQDYGEQVAGFKDIHTGKIEEVMLIKSPADLEHFKAMYGIDEEIAKEY